MLKRFIMAVLVTGMAGAVMAQTSYSLTGSVADTKGEVLAFTNCVLLHEADSSFAYGTTGDMEGQFAISHISSGSYLLRITFIGYKAHWRLHPNSIKAASKNRMFLFMLEFWGLFMVIALGPFKFHCLGH